jgi:hypothetical protein
MSLHVDDDDPGLGARDGILEILRQPAASASQAKVGSTTRRRGSASKPVTFRVGHSGHLGSKTFVDRDQGIGPIGKRIAQIARRLESILAHPLRVGVAGENLP